MNAFQFRIEGIARRSAFREEPGFREMGRYGRNAVGRFGMTDPAEMLRIALVVNDDHRAAYLVAPGLARGLGFGLLFGFAPPAFAGAAPEPALKLARVFVTSFESGVPGLTNGLSFVYAMRAFGRSPDCKAHFP